MVITLKIRLGYVAISKNLDVTSSGTMTYTHYKKLGKHESHIKLNKIIMSNFNNLESILKYSIAHEIYFYRLTSNLIPLLTHNDVDINLKKYAIEFKHIGKFIKANEMRVDTHPDQFCILNSVREEVIVNSISMLQAHYDIFQLLDIEPRTVIHVGSSVGGKKEAIERFKNTFGKLSTELQKMIMLENDDKTFTVKDTLELCEGLKIPMVLDYHHHICNSGGDDIELYINRIIKTWNGGIPKMHFSSPKNDKDLRAHNDYIDPTSFIAFIQKIKNIHCDIDIMLEAKMKDLALFKLMSDIKNMTNYEIVNESTFIIK